MLRRVHVPTIYPGELPLDAAQARHARDVLRLEHGAALEVFDDEGRVASGELIVSGRRVTVRVVEIRSPAEAADALQWTIAAAVPKGERADWMVEKLSELGTTAFIPLAAARSVVLPEGKNKRERWVRIATEAAKQSRRVGVMRIGELMRVADVLAMIAAGSRDAYAGWYFSTAADAMPVNETEVPGSRRSLVALVGPEGGWTDGELASFAAAGLTPVRLTDTVLRVETAAVAAAAVIGAVVARRSGTAQTRPA